MTKRPFGAVHFFGGFFGDFCVALCTFGAPRGAAAAAAPAGAGAGAAASCFFGGFDGALPAEAAEAASVEGGGGAGGGAFSCFFGAFEEAPPCATAGARGSFAGRASSCFGRFNGAATIEGKGKSATTSAGNFRWILRAIPSGKPDQLVRLSRVSENSRGVTASVPTPAQTDLTGWPPGFSKYG